MTLSNRARLFYVSFKPYLIILFFLRKTDGARKNRFSTIAQTHSSDTMKVIMTLLTLATAAAALPAVPSIKAMPRKMPTNTVSAVSLFPHCPLITPYPFDKSGTPPHAISFDKSGQPLYSSPLVTPYLLANLEHLPSTPFLISFSSSPLLTLDSRPSPRL
jgi:hypothetical protein